MTRWIFCDADGTFFGFAWVSKTAITAQWPFSFAVTTLPWSGPSKTYGLRHTVEIKNRLELIASKLGPGIKPEPFEISTEVQDGIRLGLELTRAGRL